MESKLGKPDPDRNVWSLLAGMRLILASIVCLSHIGMITKVGNEFSWIYNTYWSGFSAVLGFFLISGYSIAASIARKPDGFLKRRALRILPLYWLGLGISTIPILQHGQLYITSAGTNRTAPDLLQWLGNALLLQGFFTLAFDTFGQSWSLSIEAFYYAIAKSLNKLSFALIVTIIALSGLVYVVIVPKVPGIYFHMYGITAAGLMWAWLIGFSLRKFSEQIAINAGLVIFGIALLFLFDVTGPTNYSWKLFLLTSLLLLFARFVLDGAGIHNPYVLIFACYAAAILSHLLLEIPFRKFANRRRAIAAQ
jgi:peptidoglycan/LPS O-acetylase OafA/YrhL